MEGNIHFFIQKTLKISKFFYWYDLLVIGPYVVQLRNCAHNFKSASYVLSDFEITRPMTPWIVIYTVQLLITY